MALPKPTEGEQRAAFLARFEGDANAQARYPDERVRRATAEAVWIQAQETPAAVDPGGTRAAVRSNGELVMYGVIGDEVDGLDAQTIMAEVDSLGIGEGDTLTLRINSPGGYVAEGLAIYNLLRAHPARIEVVVDGVAASMASVLAMVGDRVEMPDNAVLMIHNPWNMAIGDADSLRKAADQLDVLRDAIATIYARRTGLARDRIVSMMAEETWLSAADAAEFGFADNVIEAVREAALHRFDLTQHFDKVPPALAGGNAGGAAAATTLGDPAGADTKGSAMSDANKSGAAAVTPAEPTATPPEPQASGGQSGQPAEDIRAQAQAAERDRVTEIYRSVRAANLDTSFADELVREGVAVADAHARIIDKWAEGGDQPSNPKPNALRVTAGADSRERFAEGATKALLAKAGLEGGERNEFAGYTLLELGRESLKRNNVEARGDKYAVAGQALAPMNAGYHAGGDFTSVLANVANKSMLRGWEESGETFQRWTNRGVLGDFKPTSRVDLNVFPSLDEVPEGAEYKFGTMGDRGETVSLATYGKMFAITRQAIINDDMGAFTRVPMKMGRAAIRTIGNLVYAVLNDNPTMSDGVALFHVASHGNLASTGGAPSTTTLDAGRTAMATQTDPDNNASALNIRPAFALVPVALEGDMRVVLESEFDPAKTQRTPNKVRNMADVIPDARLDAASTTAWYLAADPTMHDVIEVSYLDGQEAPTLEQRQGWNVDGVEFKVRMDAGVKALDFRTLYKNAGA